MFNVPALGKRHRGGEMKFSKNQEQSADLYALDLLNKRYGQVAGASDFMEKIPLPDVFRSGPFFARP